jgi:hypothetical protein
MSFQMSIGFTGVGRSEPVEQLASARVRLLLERFPEVTAWRVAIEAPAPTLNACHARMTIATAHHVLLIVESARDNGSGGGVFEVLDRAFSSAAIHLERKRGSSWSPPAEFSRRLGSAA